MEDHRLGPADAVARSRNHAWIVRASQLAKTVIKSCMQCKLRSRRATQQIMGEIPSGRLQMCPAFTSLSLDMFGPYLTRGMGGSSSNSFKVWGLLYTCLSTKAVAIWACPGYSTDVFLTIHQKHTAIYGEPSLIVSDQGSQLVSASKQVIDWNKIPTQTARSGTKWVFTPKGCSWRNGQAERAIGMAKKTLLHQLESLHSLDFAQLDTLFTRTASILNSRPLGVRNLSHDDFHPITPNDLLLGRAAGSQKGQELDVSEKSVDLTDMTKSLVAIEEIIAKWWKEWIRLAFPLLAPRRKWQKEQRNLQEDDIVLLRYDSKLGPEKYRLARILAVHPDQHGVVRSVTIGLRDRRGKWNEKWNRCGGKLAEMVVGVQGLVVILPREDQNMMEEDNLNSEQATEDANGDDESSTSK